VIDVDADVVDVELKVFLTITPPKKRRR